MADANRGLGERVEVFTRATSDALHKAVSEVLDARSPWQLLYRLSRLMLLGLLLYTAWLLITLQPDLAKRMSSQPAQSLQQQVRAHQGQVQTLLRNAIESNRSGLHTLALLQWDGGNGLTVLAADGRHGPLGLTPGLQPLLGVEMADVLGRAALGLCASESSAALLISAGSGKSAALLCPVGCRSGARSNGLLLALHEQHPAPIATAGWQHQQEQLQLIAARLGELLNGP